MVGCNQESFILRCLGKGTVGKCPVAQVVGGEAVQGQARKTERMQCHIQVKTPELY